MKAQLQWALLALIIVMILLIGVITPWTDLINEIVRTSSHIHATQIAEIINLMQSSPTQTVHLYNLPIAECSVSIGERVIFRSKTEHGDEKAEVDLIKTPVKIQESFIECDKEERVVLVFNRDDNTIAVGAW